MSPNYHLLTTRRSLVSDVAKTFDVLGWYTPTIVKAKILLQLLWLEKIDWDDPVRDSTLGEWSRWRDELPLLSTHQIPRCYYSKNVAIVSVQLHGYSDASEKAYSGVVYFQMEDATVGALNLRRSNCASKLVTQKMYFLFLRHCRENLS